MVPQDSALTVSFEQDLPIHLPPPGTCLRLWQTFKENFNPLTNIVHGPTAEVLLKRTVETPQNADAPSLALVSSIFGAAVATLTNEVSEV